MATSLQKACLGFIGAGQMAEAIARGLDRAGVLPVSRMFAADVNADRCQVFTSLGASVCSSNVQVPFTAHTTTASTTTFISFEELEITYTRETWAENLAHKIWSCFINAILVNKPDSLLIRTSMGVLHISHAYFDMRFSHTLSIFSMHALM